MQNQEIYFLTCEAHFIMMKLKKLGKFHWESKIWPHICTAVGKGKWSLSHHDSRLSNILKEYNIDLSKRGIR